MESEPSRCFSIFPLVFYAFILSALSLNYAYAEQYYDQQTRRYIEIQQNTSQRFQKIIPTQSQINAEQQRIAKQRAFEEQEEKNATARRFDPSRFHRTEDVGFY